MKTNLLLRALTRYIVGVVAVALLLFLPAGTMHYWQGWLLMFSLFVPMLVVGVVLYAKNPALLERRLQAKEGRAEQGLVVRLSGLLFVASFVIAGLNYRFAWLLLPAWVVWLAVGVFLMSYLLYAEVMRENSYLSRTIEVQEGQEVVVTGLYAVVRHPMYLATTLLFLTMPLVLASPLSFAVMLLYLPLIARRIADEERLLEEQLAGYKEYKACVRYKMLPFIW